jgi:hypothetical protein
MKIKNVSYGEEFKLVKSIIVKDTIYINKNFEGGKTEKTCYIKLKDKSKKFITENGIKFYNINYGKEV